MEMPQGSTLYSYLEKANIIHFSFIKSESMKAEQVLPGGLVPGEKRGGGKGCQRINMMHILCTRVCKWKNENC
jgi:hypothetical protein